MRDDAKEMNAQSIDTVVKIKMTFAWSLLPTIGLFQWAVNDGKHNHWTMQWFRQRAMVATVTTPLPAQPQTRHHFKDRF